MSWSSKADAALAPDQAQERQAERGLAGAALADHADRLTASHIEVDAVDRLDVADRAAQQAALDREMHLEPLGRDDHGRARRGNGRSAFRLGRQKMLRVGVARPVEHLVDRAGLHDLPVGHHAHPIGHLAHDREVMGDQQHRHAETLLQLLEQLQDLRLDGDVERGGRLVGDQQVRLVGERHRDHHPLALAAGQLMGIGVQALLGLLQAHQVQQLEGARARRCPAHAPMQHQGLADLPLDGVQRIERGHRLLEDDADAIAAHLPQRRLVGADQLAAVQADAAARVPRLGIGQQLEQRQRGHRFARAALADQRQGLALVDVKRDLAHRFEHAAFDLEVDREVVDLDQSHGVRPFSGRSCAGRRRRAPPRR